MKKIRNEDLDREVFRLFDRYVHGNIDRRTFWNASPDMPSED